MNVLLLIIGLSLFVCLVIVHEFGHFIVARRNGVEVEEFGLGFPPKLWGKRLKNRTLLTINLLPLGGFVRLSGEHDSDHEPGSYGAATLWTKTKIIIAGVLMNLVVAWLLFVIVALIGMPKLFDNQFTVNSDTTISQSRVYVGFVENGSPAASFLKIKDQLLAIGPPSHQSTNLTAQNLSVLTKQYAGQSVEVTYKRGSTVLDKIITLRSDREVSLSQNGAQPKGYLGVMPTEFVTRRSTWSAPIVATGVSAQLAAMTYKGLGSALVALFRGHTKEASSQVAGPVGIFVVLRDGSILGIQFILMVVAAISLTLAIINVLPIPALDGGRLFVTLVFRVTKKPLKPKTEDIIHGIGFAVLMLLLVVITIVDVKRFF